MADQDREWHLAAARGDNTSDEALQAVQLMHLRADLVANDPQLAAALAEGDQQYPDDQRRWLQGPAPWEQPVDTDPATEDAFDQLYDDDNQIFVDWPNLWTGETHQEWLYEDVFALGRGHAVYAQHKQGKSLFVLWVCAQLATSRPDVDIIYLDYEMTRDDLRERLEDMGYGPHSDLSRLHYALLPSLPPLDSVDGADALLELCGLLETPGCQLFVVIDTTARAVAGEENSNDTIRGFYRWTGIALKRRRITWVRLDHAGKDMTKGQRGGSAKGDDVDVIWRLQAGDDSMILWRDATRLSWVPETVKFTMTVDPVSYQPTIEAWPAGTQQIVKELERLEVPLTASYSQAHKMGVKGRKLVVLAALRFRRLEGERQFANEVTLGLGTGSGTSGNLILPEPVREPPPQNPLPPAPEPDGNRREPGSAGQGTGFPPYRGEPVSPDPSTPPPEIGPTRPCIRCTDGIATDLSGLCPGCLTNPGTLPPTKQEF